MSRRRYAVVLAFAVVALVPAALPAADDRPPEGVEVPTPALRQLADVRRITGCFAAQADDSALELVFRGRPSLEIKGREHGGDAAGIMRDLAVFDPATSRVVTYICFANASTRKSGEAIISLAEASGRSDKLARALLPGSSLELESIQRHRTGGTDSIYYEARYASLSGESPFLEPPVRLLLNATNGDFFRLDVDPSWLDPAAPSRARISRKSAERIVTVVLRNQELTAAFGPDAVFKVLPPAEMFSVHPNDWMGLFKGSGETPARVVWVVPVKIDGGRAAGLSSLFVDAANGLILGGMPGHSPAPAAR